MSYDDGWAALNLKMPKRIPRTEYSAESHWDLINAVTEIPVTLDSPDDVKNHARKTFTSPEHWNYDFFWKTGIGGSFLGKFRTNMGHAVYAAGGTDYNDNITSLFQTPEDVLAFDPLENLDIPDHSKTVDFFSNDYQNAVDRHPTGVNMSGTYISCVSGLIDMFGWDMLLMAMGTDSEKMGHLTNRYAEYMQHYYNALAETDVPVVMIHDDIVWTSGPFTSPDWYRKYVFPNYKKYLAPLIDSNKKIMFTSDGNYSLFIDDIADCGFNGFVLEPTTDMNYIAETYGKTHCFIGNADTRILLSGSREDIYNEVKRCFDIGKDCPGFVMAVGNHIPSNTPVENAIYYNEVYESMAVR